MESHQDLEDQEDQEERMVDQEEQMVDPDGNDILSNQAPNDALQDELFDFFFPNLSTTIPAVDCMLGCMVRIWWNRPSSMQSHPVKLVDLMKIFEWEASTLACLCVRRTDMELFPSDYRPDAIGLSSNKSCAVLHDGVALSYTAAATILANAPVATTQEFAMQHIICATLAKLATAQNFVDIVATSTTPTSSLSETNARNQRAMVAAWRANPMKEPCDLDDVMLAAFLPDTSKHNLSARLAKIHGVAVFTEPREARLLTQRGGARSKCFCPMSVLRLLVSKSRRENKVNLLRTLDGWCSAPACVTVMTPMPVSCRGGKAASTNGTASPINDGKDTSTINTTMPTVIKQSSVARIESHGPLDGTVALCTFALLLPQADRLQYLCRVLDTCPPYGGQMQPYSVKFAQLLEPPPECCDSNAAAEDNTPADDNTQSCKHGPKAEKADDTGAKSECISDEATKGE